MTREIVVIGGGISGLAAALHAAQADDTHVTLLEARDRVGGVLHTERTEGWVIEHGPESFLAMKPRGIGLARELGLDERFQTTNTATKGSYILRGGKQYPMPEGLTGLIPSEFGPMLRTPLVSPLGKARMGLDFILPPRKDDEDESLGAFVRRRLGNDVYEHLIEPLMAGIYSGSGDELSVMATFPQLRAAEREHGGLIQGVLAQKRARAARPIGHQAPIGFLSFRTGIQEFVDAIAHAIVAAGATIRTRTPVRGIARRDGGGFDIATETESMVADAVILAASAPVQARLLGDLAPKASAAMGEIPQVSSAVVMLGYRETQTAQTPRNHGYLSPRAEGRPVKAVTWLSSKWEGRAPDEHFLVRGFLGRSGDQAMLAQDDDALIQMVRDEISHTTGIEGMPVLSRVVRFDAASPQYTLGHLERVAAIESDVATIPGLAIAGNMLRGVGIPDSILAGEKASGTIRAH